MENLYRNFGSAFRRRRVTRSWDFTGIIDSKAQRHIRDVYATLCACLVMTVVGVITLVSFAEVILPHLGWGVGVMLGLLIWLCFTPNYPSTLAKRRAILFGIAFCNGLVIAPLVVAVLAEDPGLLITALGCTIALFASFTGVAFFAQRRQYLYLGGVLGSMISTLCLVRLYSYFTGYDGLYNLQLYLGLFVFSAYVVFDTQLIIEKAHLDNPDPVRDALELFVDFMNLFIKILSILSKNKKSRK